MKKTLLFGLLISFTIGTVFSQEQQIPNGGFEEWDDFGNFKDPTEWDTPNDITFTFGPAVIVVTDTTDAADGSLSAYLGAGLVQGNTAAGALTLGEFSLDAFVPTFSGGIPFTDRPLALKGSYKNYPLDGDASMIMAIFFKENTSTGNTDTIGLGVLFTEETFDNWTNFSVPINFTTEDAPDQMNIIIIPTSSITSPTLGSTMFVDNLSFEYPAAIHEQDLVETKVFPNPATDKVFFSFEKELKAEIQIYSNDGQIVYTTYVDGNKQEADLSQLSAGTYFYTVLEGNKKLSSGKIILNK